MSVCPFLYNQGRGREPAHCVVSTCAEDNLLHLNKGQSAIIQHMNLYEPMIKRHTLPAPGSP